MAAEPILSYRDLDAWNVAMDLCVLVYEVVALLPKSEQYELSSQIRRAAVSVPSNIAEGHAFGTAARCVHHLRIALGSIGELDTQFELAVRLAFVREFDLMKTRAELTRTRQLLHGLLRAKLAQILKSASKAFTLPAPAVGWMLLSFLRWQGVVSVNARPLDVRIRRRSVARGRRCRSWLGEVAPGGRL